MYYVIYNPSAQSGMGHKLWLQVKSVLEKNEKQYRVYKTTPERDASLIVKNILLNNPVGEIHLMVLGGDGTVNETIQCFAEKDFERVIFYYLPIGSANDLAKGIGCEEDVKTIAAGYLEKSEDRRMDLGLLTYNSAENKEVTSRYFIVSAGIGFDASVCEEANTSKLKKCLNKIGLGKLIYAGISFKQIVTIPKVDVTIKKDDEEAKTYKQTYFVAFMNHMYQGGGLKFCPEALDDDGYLDVCFASEISKPKVLSIIPTCYWAGHVGKEGIVISKTKTVNVKCSEPLWVHTDGEVHTRADDITVQVVPGKLRFALYK